MAAPDHAEGPVRRKGHLSARPLPAPVLRDWLREREDRRRAREVDLQAGPDAAATVPGPRAALLPVPR